MIHELLEKIRLGFRAREILFGLWELEWVLYMVGFVLKNGTTLMLWVFALEHVCRMFMFEVRRAFFLDKGWRRSQWARLGSGLVFDTSLLLIAPPDPFLYVFIFLYLFFISDFILLFSKHKKYQKYFYKFSHLFLYFILFFLT